MCREHFQDTTNRDQCAIENPRSSRWYNCFRCVVTSQWKFSLCDQRSLRLRTTKKTNGDQLNRAWTLRATVKLTERTNDVVTAALEYGFWSCKSVVINNTRKRCKTGYHYQTNTHTETHKHMKQRQMRHSPKCHTSQYPRASPPPSLPS